MFFVFTTGYQADVFQRAAIAHQLTRCLTEPLFSSATERARQLDEHFRRTGKPVGPLHGLPVSLKDTFFVKGVDSTLGLAALAFRPAKENAPLAGLLQSLGAVIVAKTNVPQTVATLDSCNHLFGRTLNPLNRQLSAGGSSGGEGALVALRGSMVGFGTDIGGSIRVPAMCCGLYGFKPSVGRVPYGGQQDGHFSLQGKPSGKGRAALQAVAGPLARCVADIDAVMREIVPRAELWGEDCIPGPWPSMSSTPGSRLTVGVLRSDGLVTPLPPIANVLDEVARILRHTAGVDVVEIPVPPVLKKCQALAGRLMDVDGGGPMLDLLEQTGEPLTPWLQGRLRRRKPTTLEQLLELQSERIMIEREMMKVWTSSSTSSSDATKNNNNGRTRTIDAIICPVAPHPVPEHDRYNAVGYTSAWVLLDYPAGTIPVRTVRESDLELGREMTPPVLGSWDRKNRELCRFPFFFLLFLFSPLSVYAVQFMFLLQPLKTCSTEHTSAAGNESTVDRRVYLDSPLSIQVVAPRLHDYELCRAMDIIDRAIRSQAKRESKL